MNNQTEQMILMKLTCQQFHYKALLQTLIDFRNDLIKTEDIHFRDDINRQFKDRALSILADDLTKDLGVSTEDVYLVLENLNLEEYIKI